MKQNKIKNGFDLEKQAIPYWREFYKDFFDIKEIKDVRDTDKGYDIEITTKNNNVYKIDEKTRSGDYFKFFQNDNKILLEVCGNIEKNKQGSSILVSVADYWAYGWFKENKILNPIVFKIKPVIKYIQQNEDMLEEKIANTDGLYHTKNLLIPYEVIENNQLNVDGGLTPWM